MDIKRFHENEEGHYRGGGYGIGGVVLLVLVVLLLIWLL